MGDELASHAPLHKVSTLQDVEQGKRLEVEETLGYAVRHDRLATHSALPFPQVTDMQEDAVSTSFYHPSAI